MTREEEILQYLAELKELFKEVSETNNLINSYLMTGSIIQTATKLHNLYKQICIENNKSLYSL